MRRELLSNIDISDIIHEYMTTTLEKPGESKFAPITQFYAEEVRTLGSWAMRGTGLGQDVPSGNYMNPLSDEETVWKILPRAEELDLEA